MNAEFDRYRRAADSVSRSRHLLTELMLTEPQRNELLAAYEQQRARGPYPSMALQILAHNARYEPTLPVYHSHVSELLQFAENNSLQWLHDIVVSASRYHGK